MGGFSIASHVSLRVEGNITTSRFEINLWHFQKKLQARLWVGSSVDESVVAAIHTIHGTSPEYFPIQEWLILMVN